MDDQYHILSLRLYDILDWIGASEKMRNRYRENGIVWEITEAMLLNCFKIKDNSYVFGSSCEGTTTNGLDSDRDILLSIDVPIVGRIPDAPQDGLSFLVVADETTKPGYLKLQVVMNKVPLNTSTVTQEHMVRDTVPQECIQTDTHDRICFKNLHKVDELHKCINSPAVTTTGVDGMSDLDKVLAFRCQHIPSFAKFWLSRVIRCNRLNDTQLHMLKESGCFLVGKSHPSSVNGPIEWRLSFSLQERELMASLNSTQHKCYILLKIIKKDIIHKGVPCVLYAVEITPCDFWTPRNLLKCTFFCIKLLLHWVKKHNCPNYFIQEENMFDRLSSCTVQQVQVVLEDMVKQWCQFLWSLTCDDIWKVLNDVMFGCGPSVFRSKHIKVAKQAFNRYITLYCDLRMLIPRFPKMCISAFHLYSELYPMQTYCLNTERFDYHSNKESRQAKCYLYPHLCLQIAQCVASIMLTISDADHLKKLFDSFKYNIAGSKDVDVISAYLIVASYYLQIVRYYPCEEFLLECETSLKSHVISVCSCSLSRLRYLNMEFIELVQDIPYIEFARMYTAGCLTFLPYQANIVPLPLHYEMYRSVYTPPGSSDEKKKIWFDWMVVDSRVYLYFLQYVLYSKTNKTVCKQHAFKNLIHIINTDRNLGHKETAFNLLGWMFKQEHEKERAMECFVKSWKIRENHNAAIWHALALIHSTNRHDSDNHVV